MLKPLYNLRDWSYPPHKQLSAGQIDGHEMPIENEVCLTDVQFANYDGSDWSVGTALSGDVGTAYNDYRYLIWSLTPGATRTVLVYAPEPKLSELL